MGREIIPSGEVAHLRYACDGKRFGALARSANDTLLGMLMAGRY